MGKNKPEPVERKHYFVDVHVEQTAATMSTLLEILPHILGKRVSSDDTRWQIFFNLIQIKFFVLDSLHFIRNCYRFAQSDRDPFAIISNGLP